jgi:putative FmdB family regulatory protein
MPIYEYRCQNGHRFEVLQKFSDEPLEACETCAAPAVRVLHPVAIHFKGSGFYSTDYGRGKKQPGEKGAEGGAPAPAAGDSKSGSTGDAKSSDSSPAKKAAEA